MYFRLEWEVCLLKIIKRSFFFGKDLMLEILLLYNNLLSSKAEQPCTNCVHGAMNRNDNYEDNNRTWRKQSGRSKNDIFRVFMWSWNRQSQRLFTPLLFCFNHYGNDGISLPRQAGDVCQSLRSTIWQRSVPARLPHTILSNMQGTHMQAHTHMHFYTHVLIFPQPFFFTHFLSFFSFLFF